ncbi:intraflagellar transport protein 20 homolog isoform X2 [Psammomys obesus]|nr:intraflagellar transport protein 20 homolog isoform X2 [Psammomys obesus]
MAKDILGEAGLHFDELNKLRVLDPEVTQQTIELKEECKDFVDKIGQFQKIVGGLIELVDQLAKEAENEKMKAIGARNLLKSIAKQREAQQQQLQALIAEKKMQLESTPTKKQNPCTIPVTYVCHSSALRRQHCQLGQLATVHSRCCGQAAQGLTSCILTTFFLVNSQSSQGKAINNILQMVRSPLVLCISSPSEN